MIREEVVAQECQCHLKKDKQLRTSTNKFTNRNNHNLKKISNIMVSKMCNGSHKTEEHIRDSIITIQLTMVLNSSNIHQWIQMQPFHLKPKPEEDHSTMTLMYGHKVRQTLHMVVLIQSSNLKKINQTQDPHKVIRKTIVNSTICSERMLIFNINKNSITHLNNSNNNNNNSNSNNHLSCQEDLLCKSRNNSNNNSNSNNSKNQHTDWWTEQTAGTQIKVKVKTMALSEVRRFQLKVRDQADHTSLIEKIIISHT